VYDRRVDENLQDLAGATLDDVTVDWRNGIVLISFLASPKNKETSAIRAIDFTRVEVPRGAGSRKVKSAARKGDVVEVAMESGEVLRVQSASFSFDLLGG
jgi:hypothetical protein